MEISTREAQWTDAAALSRLSQQLGYPITEAAIKQNLIAILQNGNERVLVAVHAKEVIGWIYVFKKITLESGSFCEIGGLVVDEQSRNKGIGRKLLEDAIQWAREKGDHSLRVRSNVKRKDAHRFYLQQGFTEIKEQKIFEIKL